MQQSWSFGPRSGFHRSADAATLAGCGAAVALAALCSCDFLWTGQCAFWQVLLQYRAPHGQESRVSGAHPKPCDHGSIYPAAGNFGS